MKVNMLDYDPAVFLKNDAMIVDFLAGSWQDSVEDANPELFLRALDAAARAKGLNAIGKRTRVDVVIKTMYALGVRLSDHSPRRRRPLVPAGRRRVASSVV